VGPGLRGKKGGFLLSTCVSCAEWAVHFSLDLADYTKASYLKLGGGNRRRT